MAGYVTIKKGMEITIGDPNAFSIYCKYSDDLACRTGLSPKKTYSFRAEKLGEGTPSERWQQVFAYEALQDGNTELSLKEAKRIDEYYQSTHPTLRGLFRFELYSEPLNDPKLEDIIRGGTQLGFLEWYASKYFDKDSGKVLLDAVVVYPKLAALIHPDSVEILRWIYMTYKDLKNEQSNQELKDDLQTWRDFLKIIGVFAMKQQFYEPMGFCLAKNRDGFITVQKELFDQVRFEQVKISGRFQQMLNDPKVLIELTNDSNTFAVEEALIELAKRRISKDVILEKLNKPANFHIYVSALEALAVWGDDQSVHLLEDTIRFGSFQAQIMAGAAMRKHLPADKLAQIIADFLDDPDPFVRGAGLKLLQFVWHKEGFDRHQNYFYEKVKIIAQFDPEKYVGMAAVECLGYSHRSELVSWLDHSDFGPEFSPFIRSAKQNCANLAAPQGYDNPIDFLSDSYLYPIQIRWITDSLKKMANEGRKSLKVLMTGSSYGTEAFSLLIEIMKDYESDPSAWGRFDPREDLKIIISDIETQPLLYAQRGYYHFGGVGFDNEFDGMQYYHKVYGTDFYRDLWHFLRQDGDQYHLEDKYSKMLEFLYVDVTDKPEKPLAEIVTFNKLDYLWAGSANATMNIVQNLYRLSSDYVTYVTWGNIFTKAFLPLFGKPVHESGPIGFMQKDPKVKSGSTE